LLYYYIDETYKTSADYWHCNIGGALINPSLVIPIEIALTQCLHKRLSTVEHVSWQSEFKYSDFFRDADDDLKIELCRTICETVSEFEFKFIISHAKYRKEWLTTLAKFMGGEQKTIQNLAYFNLPYYIAPYTATSLVQTIVDLGLSESFKPIYQMYVGAARGIVAFKGMGLLDEDISRPNFQNLPTPLFVDSKDSRLIQLSDLLNGLLLAKEMGEMTEFKQKLLDATSSLENRISLHTVEWKKMES
jgi:hypothetical protein